jgi:hypothetical protein
MTPNRLTSFTPFFMVYDTESVIPSDLEHDSPHIIAYTEQDKESAHQDGLDLLEEEHELALSRTAIYQQGLRHYHSR